MRTGTTADTQLRRQIPTQPKARAAAKSAHGYGMFMIALIGSLWLLAGVALANTDKTDRTKIESFLTTTGFDVALESIKLSAESAPLMLGLDKDEFGDQWVRLSGDVFDTETMHDMALNILQETLTPELLNHATEFYASDLGQRLVMAENASHLKEDEDLKTEAGATIVAGLVQHGSDRLGLLKRMNAAVDGASSSVKAIQEIQVRFLMAAAGAGVIELQLDEPDLREMMSAQAPDLHRTIMLSALSGSAYTYQAFSDAEVETYAIALEHPKMKQVYQLMSAVQYEVMANRFETLAAEMAKLQPSTDL